MTITVIELLPDPALVLSTESKSLRNPLQALRFLAIRRGQYCTPKGVKF